MVDRCQRPARQHIPSHAGQHDDRRKTQDENEQNFSKLLLDALLRRGRVALLFFFELLSKLVAHGQEDGGRIDDQHQGKHRRVPGGQPNADRGTEPPATHGSPSCSTKPTPRTVWINRTVPSVSTFLRKRVICTSMTLSMGVARRGSLHTSRASISRDTGWPWCRRGNSSRSNSRLVRSSNRSPRTARRATRSSSRSAAFNRSTSDGRPRRSSARIRASSSGSANGLTR